MLAPKILEQRNEKIVERLDRREPLCMTTRRFSEVMEMTLNDLKVCDRICVELESKLKESEPDYKRIFTTISANIDSINALLEMKFHVVLEPYNFSDAAYGYTMELRACLLWEWKSRFKKLLNKIPEIFKTEDTDSIPIKYRSEKGYPFDSDYDVPLIFEKFPHSKEVVERILESSDLKIMVKHVEAAYACYPLNDYEYDPNENINYGEYTIVIISFLTCIKKEDLQKVFPDAFIPYGSDRFEYYQRFFCFKSHFRKLITYDDVVKDNCRKAFI